MSTSVTKDTAARRAELEERTRLAWGRYSERVRDLEGRDYDDAERDAWAELQAAMRLIERELEGLAQAA